MLPHLEITPLGWKWIIALSLLTGVFGWGLLSWCVCRVAKDPICFEGEEYES